MRAIVMGLAAAGMVAASSLAAWSAERTIIVLDASGSMWGQIDGKPKLEIARETLRSVLPTIPADRELGLMAYGHRQKGSCTDIELVVEPAAGTADAIAAAADKMKFLGKTPLSDAVRQAAEALRYTEDKATVVLITDGIETCNADPCALGKELEQSGVDFTAHVVGFGLSRDEGRQVACLAENTGGRYIQASDGQGLNEALSETVAAAPASARAEQPEKPEPVVLPEATVSAPDSAPIGSGIEVLWTGPGTGNDYIDIVPAGYDEVSGELAYAYVDRGSPLPIRVPGKVGDYVVRYVWEGPDGRHVLASKPIGVIDSEVALVAPPKVSVGEAFNVEWKGPDSGGDYIDIVPAGYTEVSGEISYFYVEGGNPAKIEAPGKAGDYQIRYILEGPDGRRMLTSIPLEVSDAAVSLAFQPTVGAGEKIDIHWTGPASSGDYLDLVAEGHTEPSGETAYFYIDGSPDGETATMQAPGDAGEYQVRYVLEAPGGRRVMASQPITVTPAAATLRAPEAVETGTTFAVEWTGPMADQDYIDLVPQGHSETSGELAYFYVAQSEDGTAKLTAPEKPGAYELRYVLEAPGGRRVLTRVPITVQ